MQLVFRSGKPQIGPSTALFLGGVGFMWAVPLSKEWGFEPFHGIGIVVALSISLGLALAGLIADVALAHAGIPRRIRFGIWTGAVFGPYLSLAAINAWGNTTLSHMLGVVVMVFMFGFGYHLEKLSEVRFWPEDSL